MALLGGLEVGLLYMWTVTRVSDDLLVSPRQTPGVRPIPAIFLSLRSY